MGGLCALDNTAGASGKQQRCRHTVTLTEPQTPTRTPAGRNFIPPAKFLPRSKRIAFRLGLENTSSKTRYSGMKCCLQLCRVRIKLVKLLFLNNMLARFVPRNSQGGSAKLQV
jgi:hypothetical protein